MRLSGGINGTEKQSARVEAHAAGAEQSDDRTQLLLRWRGP